MRFFAPIPLIVGAVRVTFAASASANPIGATVVNGQVTVNPAGNLLSITNSPNSIINWQSFSIGANEITRFTQQSAASAVLNRVVGAGGAIDPSVILGALQSNGRVFLLNPSGIVFGAGSQIDVAGLVASSLNLSNADFLGGRLRFTEVPGAGAVVNQGSINAASGGQVYLVGPSVTNSGIIATPQGEVILAAGNSVELVNPGAPNLRVEISAPDNQAVNLGQIMASSGRIGIYAGLIKTSGTLSADSAVTGAGGEILLKATKSVTVEGTITAGDRVTILAGEDVSVLNGTNLQTGPFVVPDLGSIQLIGGPAAGGNVALLGGNNQGTGIPSGLTLSLTNPTAGQGTISLAGATGSIHITTAGNSGALTITAAGSSSPGTVTVNSVAIPLVTNPESSNLTIAAAAGSTPATVTANNVTVPLAVLSSAGPLHLVPTIDLLALPALQAVTRSTMQITGSLSTISQVNDFARTLGGAAPGLLAPPRASVVFE